MKTYRIKNISLRTIRKLADKYGITWHPQGNGWVINGVQAHYSYAANTAGEKAALVDYMTNWGRDAMIPEDYNTIREAKAQISTR
jgi:hypothetical protein